MNAEEALLEAMREFKKMTPEEQALFLQLHQTIPSSASLGSVFAPNTATAPNTVANESLTTWTSSPQPAREHPDTIRDYRPSDAHAPKPRSDPKHKKSEGYLLRMTEDEFDKIDFAFSYSSVEPGIRKTKAAYVIRILIDDFNREFAKRIKHFSGKDPESLKPEERAEIEKKIWQTWRDDKANLLNTAKAPASKSKSEEQD